MIIKAIIFDLDNTLLDRKKSFYNFCNKFMDKYFSDIRGISRERIIQQITFLDRNGYCRKTELFKVLLEELPWQHKPHICELKEYWQREFGNCLEPMKGMNEVLDAFKHRGYKLAIITNGSTAMQRLKLRRLNIFHYFHSVIISEAVKVKKPDPKIFHMTLKKLDVKPKEAIYIGDNALIDVIGASSAGLNTVWLKNNEAWNIEYVNPGKTVAALEDLINLLSSFEVY